VGQRRHMALAPSGRRHAERVGWFRHWLAVRSGYSRESNHRSVLGASVRGRSISWRSIGLVSDSLGRFARCLAVAQRNRWLLLVVSPAGIACHARLARAMATGRLLRSSLGAGRCDRAGAVPPKTRPPRALQAGPAPSCEPPRSMPARDRSPTRQPRAKSLGMALDKWSIFCIQLPERLLRFSRVNRR
jgi:hypothetical protein